MIDWSIFFLYYSKHSIDFLTVQSSGCPEDVYCPLHPRSLGFHVHEGTSSQGRVQDSGRLEVETGSFLSSPADWTRKKVTYQQKRKTRKTPVYLGLVSGREKEKISLGNAHGVRQEFKPVLLL